MIEIHTEPTHRVISIITLIQIGVVIGGTAFVRVMLKANGYHQGEYPTDEMFSDGPQFIWRHGFAFLLVPAIWVALAFWSARPASSPWQWRGLFIFGIAAILFGIFVSFVTGFATAPMGPLMPIGG